MILKRFSSIGILIAVLMQDALMKKCVLIMLGVGLLALVSALIILWQPSDRSSNSASLQRVGTSTLSHGGPPPARPERPARERPDENLVEQETGR